VEWAPNQPEPYAARGSYLLWQKEVSLSIDIARGEKVRPFTGTVVREGLDDLRRAVELGLTDPREVAKAASFEVMAGAAEIHPPPRPSQARLWKLLPEINREHVQRCIAQLRNLSDDKDSALAGKALCALAMVRYAVVGDLEAAEKSLRRALKLDPKNGPAWDLLLAVLDEEKQDDACLTVCTDRIKECDCCRSHLLLAMCHVRHENYEPAEEEYRAAVKLEPHDFMANLSLATILLKRAHDEASMKEAIQVVQRTIRLGSEEVPPEQKLHVAAVVGVAKAMTGQEEEARRILERVLFENPEHEIARDALDILKK
jgi:tetratricopeptide (TPR) repeat protein